MDRVLRTETTDLIRAFLDHFLKGETTGFADKPPVRLEVRRTRDRVHAVRWESAWPLPRTEYRPLYLSANGGLGPDRAGVAESASYSAATGHLAFEHVFAEDTELSGYMKLSLWVAAEGAADMALCCFVDKRDSAGRSVRFNGSAGQTEDMVTRGYGRATRRQLDDAASTPWHPVPLCAADEQLGRGEIVQLEIALCPSSTFFAAGERLVLIVSGHDIVYAPIFRKDTSCNRGRHILHFGG
ncbi:MAG: CocE/NonD family hydrolase, partial [Pseudomonadota bacterium]